MLEGLTKFALAYMLGNLMGGQVVGRLRGGVDLRRFGSGNVGAANALRTQGKAFALAVLLIDAGKGAAAALAIPAISWPATAPFVLPLAWLQYLCGIGVVLGHCYPFMLGFRGGKGAATLAGVFAALLWPALIWMLASFVLVVLLTGYVSLATLASTMVAVLYVALVDDRGLASATGAFTLAMAALVLFKHRANIRRLRRGAELRFDRAMVIQRWLQR